MDKHLQLQRSGTGGRRKQRCPQRHLWASSSNMFLWGCLCPNPRSSWSAEMGSLKNKGPITSVSHSLSVVEVMLFVIWIVNISPLGLIWNNAKSYTPFSPWVRQTKPELHQWRLKHRWHWPQLENHRCYVCSAYVFPPHWAIHQSWLTCSSYSQKTKLSCPFLNTLWMEKVYLPRKGHSKKRKVGSFFSAFIIWLNYYICSSPYCGEQTFGQSWSMELSVPVPRKY